MSAAIARVAGVTAVATRSLHADLCRLRPRMVEAAQAVLDAWVQVDGVDEELGTGGACDRIAAAIADVVSEELGDVEEVMGGQDGDDHAFYIFFRDNESYMVDIPCSVYETGGGYTWRKREGVRLDVRDVLIAGL